MYTNPYEAAAKMGGSWLKANFHVHTHEDSDRSNPGPEEVIKQYRDAGYDVLTLSNHSRLTDTHEAGQKHDILTMNGMEYIEYDGILCIGIDSFIKGQPQEVIYECARQGGFSVICHPGLKFEKGMIPTLSRETIKKLRGYTGIEILNPVVYSRFKGSGLAVDLWDELLSSGRLVWAFGNDDSHRFTDIDRAWNMIYAKSRTAGDVKEAIARGCFYVSTGLFIDEITVYDDSVNIAAGCRFDKPDDIRYTFYGGNGKVLKDSVGRSAVLRFDGKEPYIRIRAMSEHGAALWTQPVYNDALLKV